MCRYMCQCLNYRLDFLTALATLNSIIEYINMINHSQELRCNCNDNNYCPTLEKEDKSCITDLRLFTLYAQRNP